MTFCDVCDVTDVTWTCVVDDSTTCRFTDFEPRQCMYLDVFQIVIKCIATLPVTEYAHLQTHTKNIGDTHYDKIRPKVLLLTYT